MIEKYPILYKYIQLATVLFIAMGLFIPSLIQQSGLSLALILIVLVGIPHGATDHLIFLQLNKRFLGSSGLKQFYFKYLALIFIYALIWFLFPILAFGIFMILSMYHFGQSNWNYIKGVPKTWAGLIYLLWGGFVILFPVLWHFEESSLIISQLLGIEIMDFSQQTILIILASLSSINLIIPSLLYWRGAISLNAFRTESFHLILLSLVFLLSPLMLGFAIYFVFWHSLSSIKDQISFFQRKISTYNWLNYLLQTLPLTAVAVLGLGVMLGGQYYITGNIHISILFIFISVITIPHMILIDMLYEEKPNIDV